MYLSDNEVAWTVQVSTVVGAAITNAEGKKVTVKAAKGVVMTTGGGISGYVNSSLYCNKEGKRYVAEDERTILLTGSSSYDGRLGDQRQRRSS